MSGRSEPTDGGLYYPDLSYERNGLPEDMRMLLSVAFEQDVETHAEQYVALGRSKAVELKDFLAEQTVRTLREWMDARDSSATASHAQEKSGLQSAGPDKSVPNLPLQALINSWLEHWWFAWILNDPSCLQALKKGILPLDGAEEYRRFAQH